MVPGAYLWSSAPVASESLTKNGKVLPEPFIDLTNFNPLGSDVQTGFVEQGLWSIPFHPKFKDNGYVFVHYASLPFNGASIIARITVDPKSPDQVTKENGTKANNGGCSSQGLGVANYGGLTKTYLVGDWCSGRLFGVAWDDGAKKWQMQEFMPTQLQFTAGNVDADGAVLAVNCYCFYTDDKGPNANPVGALWRILPADKVPSGTELAKAK
jgi:hypothetical protein